MIISRAPVRISLGGGGTDLASYYSKFGGFLIGAAIDRYVFISVNKRFFHTVRLSYSKTEIVDSIDDIEHNIFRETLKSLGITSQIEIVSISDVPANCGLGSSGAFTVSLLNALHTYKRDYISLKELAEEACTLEIDILGEPIGKQDQYISSFGGLTCLTFEPDGNVIVEALRMSNGKINELESNILLFYTGKERKASRILAVQDKKTAQNDADTLEILHKIKQIGLESRKALENENLDLFGELLDLHWETKKRLSSQISDPFIDECYEAARKNGAVGGKIMGAGGGGFFMFYCPDHKIRLIEALKKKGLLFTDFRFDFEGAKILVNMKTRQ